MLGIKNLNLNNKKILIRSDFNVPIANGQILNQHRIKASIPTIRYALEKNAAVILVSHLGDPQSAPSSVNKHIYSLQQIVPVLEKILQKPVAFLQDWYNQDTIDVQPGKIVLCENVRFTAKEQQNDPEFAKRLANLADCVVIDAFATTHRKHASTYGVLSYAPIAVAGLLLHQEICLLQQALANPKQPLVAFVGGAKITTKLPMLKALIQVSSQVALGGAIATSYLAAHGYNPGKSLLDYVGESNIITSDKILLPIDVLVLNQRQQVINKDIHQINNQDQILDIGQQTIRNYQQIIKTANTIIWNGPMGKIEDPRFAQGTVQLAKTIANHQCFAIIGGGETLAISKYLDLSKFSHCSSGGGAFLEFIGKQTLPTLDLLNQFG